MYTCLVIFIKWLLGPGLPLTPLCHIPQLILILTPTLHTVLGSHQLVWVFLTNIWLDVGYRTTEPFHQGSYQLAGYFHRWLGWSPQPPGRGWLSVFTCHPKVAHVIPNKPTFIHGVSLQPMGVNPFLQVEFQLNFN